MIIALTSVEKMNVFAIARTLWLEAKPDRLGLGDSQVPIFSSQTDVRLNLAIRSILEQLDRR